MKNLPCIVFLAAVASLVVLTIVSSVDVSIEFTLVASYLVGFFAAAGLVATFLMDYAPRSSTSARRSPVADTHDSVSAIAGSRNTAARRATRSPGNPALEGAMATLGLRSHPATVVPM